MFNAPIPPVPLPPAQPIQAPASPVSPDPETSRRVQRVQELIHNPELPGLFREAVRIFQALPQKPRKDQRVRSNEQIAKRRTQRLQRKSYVRTSARAEAQSRWIRSAEDVAALARKRYNFLFTNGLNGVKLRELDEQFADLIQAEEEFPPQLPDMKDLYADFYNEMMELTRTWCAHHADALITTWASSHPYLSTMLRCTFCKLIRPSSLLISNPASQHSTSPTL